MAAQGFAGLLAIAGASALWALINSYSLAIRIHQLIYPWLNDPHADGVKPDEKELACKIVKGDFAL